MDHAVIEAVAAFLLEKIPQIKITSKTRGLTTTGNNTFKVKEGLIDNFISLMPVDSQAELFKRFGGDVAHLKNFQNSASLEAEMVRRLVGTDRDYKVIGEQKAETAAEIDAAHAFFNDSITTPLSKLKLIVNVKNRKKSFLYDPTRDIQHHCDYELIVERLKTVLEKSYTSWKMTNSEDCLLSYEPLQKSRITYDGKRQCKIFNTFNEAEWRGSWIPDPKARCPDEIEEYFKYFLKDDESRNTCKAWLRDCTFDRAEPILVLCGVPGSGKNIFVEHIAAALVGHNNYRSATRGFIDSNFHSGVTNCRLFFLDEFPLNVKNRETLKAYHNGTASIERKGVDVGDPEKLHASFVLANNLPVNIKLEYTDRKFYVPLLADTPLLDSKSLGQTKVNKLLALLKDPTYVQRLASYLYHNFEAGSAARFGKNELFKKLCVRSYPEFFRAFIEMCELRETFTSVEFMRRRRPIELSQIEDLINHYDVNFKESLAEITKKRDGSWTVKSLIYKGDPSGDTEASKTTVPVEEPTEVSGQLLA